MKNFRIFSHQGKNRDERLLQEIHLYLAKNNQYSFGRYEIKIFNSVYFQRIVILLK